MNSKYSRLLLRPITPAYSCDFREVYLDEPCKIGRAVGKIKPHKNNAIFDCKVLSRNHAIIWYENAKFFLKDTKSSNGTFANKQRLSEGCEESNPYEIFSNDEIQFGVDVTDNQVVHSCIISQVSLYHPDGSEALPNLVALSQGDIHKLSQIISEVKIKEINLNKKQNDFNEILEEILNSTSESWKAMIDEDSLLSRILVLETELEIYKKPLDENEMKHQLLQLNTTKYEEETLLKTRLSQIYEEKSILEANIDCLKNQISEKDYLNDQLNKSLAELNKQLENLNETKLYLQEELNNIQNHFQQMELKYKEIIQEVQNKSDFHHHDITHDFDDVAKEIHLLVEPHEISLPLSDELNPEIEDKPKFSPSSSNTSLNTLFTPSSDAPFINIPIVSVYENDLSPDYTKDVKELPSQQTFIFAMDDETLNNSELRDLPITKAESYPQCILPAKDFKIKENLKHSIIDFNKTIEKRIDEVNRTCLQRLNLVSIRLEKCIRKLNNSQILCHKSFTSKEELVKECKAAKSKLQETENFKLLLSEGQKSLRDKDKLISVLKENFQNLNINSNNLKQENDYMKQKIRNLQSELNLNKVKLKSVKKENEVIEDQTQPHSFKFNENTDIGREDLITPIRVEEQEGVSSNGTSERLIEDYKELAYQAKILSVCSLIPILVLLWSIFLALYHKISKFTATIE
ncbi:unnamed protein product [Gordionus sp. m RMFG-2023]|uniref:sarcolemmal membrane-associated protein-like isoform X2 n=1 Tax=Gordionus sp. m RMFG-2023 TaxID=3053472 RepID=UPI0030E2B541